MILCRQIVGAKIQNLSFSINVIKKQANNPLKSFNLNQGWFELGNKSGCMVSTKGCQLGFKSQEPGTKPQFQTCKIGYPPNTSYTNQNNNIIIIVSSTYIVV